MATTDNQVRTITSSPELKKDASTEKEIKEQQTKKEKEDSNIERLSKTSEGLNNDITDKRIYHKKLQDDVDNLRDDLKDELENQKLAEKAAFKKLIEDNVQLANQVQRLVVQTKQAEGERDTKILEYHDIRERNENLEKKVTELQDKEIENKRNDPDTNAQMVKDLRFRLVRLGKDYEDKNQQIQNLQEEVKHTRLYAEALEGHIDPVKVTEIKTKFEEDLKKEKNTKKEERNNVVIDKSGGSNQSKVCVVM